MTHRTVHEINSFDWQNLLTELSQSVLDSLDERTLLTIPSAMRESRWLGYPPATSAAISALEERLQLELPRSYKNFLSVSNGFQLVQPTIGGLYCVDAIERLTVLDSQLIEGFGQGYQVFGEVATVSDSDYLQYDELQDTASFRLESLPSTIVVGGASAQGYYLLNPDIIFENGEWEAWVFANWLPGARRSPSFLDMMLSELNNV